MIQTKTTENKLPFKLQERKILNRSIFPAFHLLYGFILFRNFMTYFNFPSNLRHDFIPLSSLISLGSVLIPL